MPVASLGTLAPLGTRPTPATSGEQGASPVEVPAAVVTGSGDGTSAGGAPSTGGPAVPGGGSGGGGSGGSSGGGASGDGRSGGVGRGRRSSGRRFDLAERWTRPVLAVCALVPLLALVAVVTALLVKAWPVIAYNGFGFFTHVAWRPGSQYAQPVVTGGVAHPPGASFGALPLIAGTVESSFIALVLAVPIAIGTALVVVEKLPPRLSGAIGLCLEVLAGVPSVVIGLWGALALGPFLSHHVSPFIAGHVPDVPVLRFLKGSPGYGEGLFTSGVVLAVMILPIIAATTRDLLRQVPRDAVDGAVALGMTEAEALRAVTLPWVRTGIVGASVLGLGRALGETMAVAMVSGAVLGAVPHNLYQTMTTIAATIVSQLDSAFTDATGFFLRTLAEAGLVLVVITLLVNVGARMLVRRVASTALPVGRGI
ncbi:MAG: phosphate ABC transporter permease subunit PstC [Actinomycetota bacterium]|jgi:phosphate transport system permease protein|nr:phosphate ABC transporter permease subunit PstC [Actinomycetota bacterium]